MMDKGVFKHHVQEQSTLEECTATFIPYWIIPISARTQITAMDEMQQVAQTATSAALMGVILGGLGGGFGGGGGGGRRRSFDMTSLLGPANSLTGGLKGGVFLGRLPGTMMYGMGMGMGGGGARKTYQLDQNYNFPVVAMRDLTEYQPKDYTFALSQRVLFDVSKIDKSIKVLNGDISEDVAKAQAKTYVDQLQSQKAHEQHKMVQQIQTQMDVSDGELLHVPVWFVRYDHKGNEDDLRLRRELWGSHQQHRALGLSGSSSRSIRLRPATTSRPNARMIGMATATGNSGVVEVVVTAPEIGRVVGRVDHRLAALRVRCAGDAVDVPS